MHCIRPWRKKVNGQLIDLDCGRCGSCRHNRRAEWSFRISEELHHSLNGFFVTLTYEDSKLPWGDGVPSLSKDDFQKFMKRLRKFNKNRFGKVKYYCVGEYGSITFRPHYHAILFNIHPETINNLESIWGKGHINVKHAHSNNIHYIAKYHVNYRKGYEDKEDEFALMSKGIGIGYISRNGDWHKNNEALYIKNNGFKQKLPRYYQNKIWGEEQIKRTLLPPYSMGLVRLGQIKKIRTIKRFELDNKMKTEQFERLKEKAREQLEESQAATIEILIKQGVKDPEGFMEASNIYLAEKVMHKGRTSDKL